MIAGLNGHKQTVIKKEIAANVSDDIDMPPYLTVSSIVGEQQCLNFYQLPNTPLHFTGTSYLHNR